MLPDPTVGSKVGNRHSIEREIMTPFHQDPVWTSNGVRELLREFTGTAEPVHESIRRSTDFLRIQFP